MMLTVPQASKLYKMIQVSTLNSALNLQILAKCFTTSYTNHHSNTKASSFECIGLSVGKIIHHQSSSSSSWYYWSGELL